MYTYSTGAGGRSLTLLAALMLAAAVPAEAQLSPIRTFKTFPTIAAPQAVTASYDRLGVLLAWQPVAEAGQYLVLRAPDVATPGTQIGTVAAGTLGFQDRGFNSAAAYQVVAVAPDGRRGSSAVVAYNPPATLAIDKTAFSGVSRTAMTGLFPSITGLLPSNSGTTYTHLGETVQVQGSGLDGLTSVGLVTAYCDAYGCKVWPTGAMPTPVTLSQASSSGFSFVVPTLALGGYANQLQPYFLVITKGTTTIMSAKPLQIGYPPVVRKIISVAQPVVRAGQRVKVTGVGFSEVIGGYIGSGSPGSTANPLLNPWNRSDTYVELETPPGCAMEGILMLHMPVAGGTPNYITGDTPIMVGCASATPAGMIVGSEGTQTGIVSVLPGSSISIRGTNLRWVTKVVDGQNRSYPFTYAKLSGGIELLSVKLPTTPGPWGAQFFLESPLTDPVVNGTVTGSVSVMAVPTWYRISPAWAEPGQILTVNGHNLKYQFGTTQVRVGGVPAQVISGNELTVSFRVPSNASALPIEIENEAGKVQLTGPFTAATGVSHPGFFLVMGASSVTQIIQPNPTLAANDILTVRGQNLARLGGICVMQAAGAGNPAMYVKLPRVPVGAGLGYETSNTEMQVSFGMAPSWLATGSVQLYASTAPVGDYPPSLAQFSCQPNPAGISWP